MALVFAFGIGLHLLVLVSGLQNQSVSIGEAPGQWQEVSFDIRLFRYGSFDDKPIYVQNFAVTPIDDVEEDTVEVFATAMGGNSDNDELVSLANVTIRNVAANSTVDLGLILNLHVDYLHNSSNIAVRGFRIRLQRHNLLLGFSDPQQLVFDDFKMLLNIGLTRVTYPVFEGRIFYSADAIPTPMPTLSPTTVPSASPTIAPTQSPTWQPTSAPPTLAPTPIPTNISPDRLAESISVEPTSFQDTDGFVAVIVVASALVALCGGGVFWRYKSRWYAAALAGARGFNEEPNEDNDEHPDMPLTEKGNREPSMESQRTEPDIEEGDEKAQLAIPSADQRQVETEHVQGKDVKVGEPSLTLSQPQEDSRASESELKDLEEGKPRKSEEYATPTRCVDDVEEKGLKYDEGEGEVVDDADETSTQLESDDEDRGEVELAEEKDGEERLPAVVASEAEMSPTPRETAVETTGTAIDANTGAEKDPVSAGSGTTPAAASTDAAGEM